MKRKADAHAFLARIEANKNQGSYLDPSLGRMAFSDFWLRFLDASPHLRPSTRRLYEVLATRYLLPAFGHRRLNATSPLDVRAFLSNIASDGVGAATSRPPSGCCVAF